MIENSSGMNRQSLDQVVIVTRGMPDVREQCDETRESRLRLNGKRAYLHFRKGCHARRQSGKHLF